MITKYVEFNVICDICRIDGCNCMATDWLPEEEVNDNNWDIRIAISEKGSRDMRRIAKEYGWIYKNGKDICPKCQAEKKI
jgi:hypothetical protein